MPKVEVADISQEKLDRINAILKGIKNGSGAFHAIGAAMKRAAKAGEHEAAKYASETYNITQGTFRGQCRISFKMEGGHEGVAKIEVLFAGAVIPLIEFKGTAAGPHGVQVSPKMGGGNLRSAFLAEIYSKGIFERIGLKRFPVEQKYGPSTGHMMQDNEVSEKTTNKMIETFDSRIEHEISRILGGGF
ncbi:MAG: hypothetical protein IKO25_00280 [Clostridia bacterium]|nr:hypothetical protein [Clostridia bacterium]